MSNQDRIDELASQVRRLRLGSYGASISLAIAFVLGISVIAVIHLSSSAKLERWIRTVANNAASVEDFVYQVQDDFAPKFSKLESKLNELETTVDELEVSVSGQYGTGGLRREFSELESELRSVETELSELDRQVDRLMSDVLTLQTRSR